MVKIISQGKTREERVIGMHLKCYRCGTQFEIEAGDQYGYREATEQRDNDSISMACPHCGALCGAAVPGTNVGF